MARYRNTINFSFRVDNPNNVECTLTGNATGNGLGNQYLNETIPANAEGHVITKEGITYSYEDTEFTPGTNLSVTITAKLTATGYDDSEYDTLSFSLQNNE